MNEVKKNIEKNIFENHFKDNYFLIKKIVFLKGISVKGLAGVVSDRIQLIKNFDKECEKCNKFSICNNLIEAYEPSVIKNINCKTKVKIKKSFYFKEEEVKKGKNENLEFYYE